MTSHDRLTGGRCLGNYCGGTWAQEFATLSTDCPTGSPTVTGPGTSAATATATSAASAGTVTSGAAASTVTAKGYATRNGDMNMGNVFVMGLAIGMIEMVL